MCGELRSRLGTLEFEEPLADADMHRHHILLQRFAEAQAKDRRVSNCKGRANDVLRKSLVSICGVHGNDERGMFYIVRSSSRQSPSQ